MENRKMTKSEIDIEIKDLLWELVRRWRVIIVMACICAIALTSYQYRSDMNKTDVVVVKKTQEELEKAMSVQDVSEVSGTVAMLHQLEQKSSYMDKSVLMQINPYAENAVLLQYMVIHSENAMEKTLTDAYISYVEDGYLAKTLVWDGLTETEYIDELLSVVRDTSDIYITSGTSDESVKLNITGEHADSCITIKVCGIDEESCKALAEEVKASMEQYDTVLNQKADTHEMILITEQTCVVVDNALAELQNRNTTAIKTLSNNIDKMKNEMTGDQITLYTYRVTGVAQTASVAATSTVSEAKAVTISVKHAVIGFVVGVVLGCGMILARYLLSAKLRNSEEIKMLYQIKVLGNIENPQKRKRVFAFVDRLIDKVQKASKKTLTYEQAVQMVCANIAIDCKKNNKNKVCLTGSMLEKMPEKIINDIADICAKKDIVVEKVSAAAYDAEGLEALEQTGSVVFLEKQYTSFYDEIYKEIVLCRENGIRIIGTIVVGE